MLYKARVTKSRLIKTLVFTWMFYLLLAVLHYLLRYHAYIYVTSLVILTITSTVLIACVLSAMIAYLVKNNLVN